MPRSKSVHAYPTVYWKMLEAFKRSILPIHVETASKAEAYNRKNEWHAFVRALEHSVDERHKALSVVGRGRICNVKGPAENIIVWQSRDTGSFVDSLEDALDHLELPEESDQALLREITTENMPAEEPDEEPLDASDMVLEDFLATEAENTIADDLFDEFLEEAASTPVEKSESILTDMLHAPLKHIPIYRPFSQEDNDPTDI